MLRRKFHKPHNQWNTRKLKLLLRSWNILLKNQQRIMVIYSYMMGDFTGKKHVDLLKYFKFVISCFAFIFTNLDFLMLFISTKLLKFWDMWCWKFLLTRGRVECTLQPPPSPSSFLLDLWRIECKPKKSPPHPIKFCLDFLSKLNWQGWIFFKIYFQG